MPQNKKLLDPMIYCIWYPSGGFGHLINSILNVYGKKFARPKDQSIEFSENGDAHAVELVAPRYSYDLDTYNFKFDHIQNYSVLIDNGINNEDNRFKTVFADASVIKLCYNDNSWPIVARTMIDKAMKSDLTKQLPVDPDKWSQNEPWAQREKYFLYLRDHHLRSAWKPDPGTHNLMIDQLLEYDQLREGLTQFGIELDDFRQVWNQWRQVNHTYIDPVTNALDVLHKVKNNIDHNLDTIDNLWDQAVLYYFLWTEFGQEVPHNDYADFFLTTYEIRKWLKL
jgi:hypothetical protein